MSHRSPLAFCNSRREVGATLKIILADTKRCGGGKSDDSDAAASLHRPLSSILKFFKISIFNVCLCGRDHPDPGRERHPDIFVRSRLSWSYKALRDSELGQGRVKIADRGFASRQSALARTDRHAWQAPRVFCLKMVIASFSSLSGGMGVNELLELMDFDLMDFDRQDAETSAPRAEIASPKAVVCGCAAAPK